MSATVCLRVALYARVARGRQAEHSRIAGQVAALRQRICADGCVLTEELCFSDDGPSGATLRRPALQRLRDCVANAPVDRLYVYSPDRLSRKVADYATLVEEFRLRGVEVIFLKR